MRVLVLNGGSSSFKCWYSDLPAGPLPIEASRPQWSARADWSRHSGVAEVRIAASGAAAVSQQLKVDSPVQVLQPVLESLLRDKSVDLAGHRIVHGGPRYRQSTRLTPEVRKAIAEQVEFAPAHNPGRPSRSS